jgi:RNA polymerase sigma-70 factor (ECF subfamily)
MRMTRPDASLETAQLRQLVQRWQAGDAGAADTLFRVIAQRLEHLARRMLRGYPNVRQWADTADVLQGTVYRLLNTLRQLQPPTTRDFFNLAANHVRRELLDLARRHARRELPRGTCDSDAAAGAIDPASAEQEELELWSRFHEAVEELPLEDREVFSLAFYHAWTQQQIADLLGVNERTIRRRWQAACLELNRRLGGQLPGV